MANKYWWICIHFSTRKSEEKMIYLQAIEIKNKYSKFMHNRYIKLTLFVKPQPSWYASTATYLLKFHLVSTFYLNKKNRSFQRGNACKNSDNRLLISDSPEIRTFFVKSSVQNKKNEFLSHQFDDSPSSRVVLMKVLKCIETNWQSEKNSNFNTEFVSSSLMKFQLPNRTLLLKLLLKFNLHCWLNSADEW